MLLPRRDKLLNEALEVLDERLRAVGGNIPSAYELLLPAELDFIDQEIERCVADFRYYAENYHSILSKEDGVKTLYPFKDSQEIFLEALTAAERISGIVRLLILKARQLGISTVCAARTFHWTIFDEAKNSLVVAQDIGQADYLFDMSRFALDNLPWWMRPEVRYDQKGRYLVFDRKDESVRAMNPGLRSQLLVAAANQPGGVAVGKGLNIAHGSELSAWANGRVLAEQLLPAVEGPGSKGLMESTARGRGNFFHRLWKAAEDGDIPWTALFIPAYVMRSYSLPIIASENFSLTDEEKATKENVFRDTGDIVPDEHFKWRRMKEKESEQLTSEESVDQEYPLTSESSFQATGLSAFNKKRLMEMLRTTCRNPFAFGEIDLEFDDVLKRWNPKPVIRLRKVNESPRIPPQKEYGSRFYVWEMPEKGRDYFIGGDPALGIPGGAFSCGEVFKIGRRGEPDVQVAEWHGWMDAEPFSRVLAALGYWYNTAQVSIEMNNDCGGACHFNFTRILEYPNWFQWERYDKISVSKTNYVGWVTNNKTRGYLLSKFRLGINEGTLVLRSKPLVDQCLNFARAEGEVRYEDQEGSGDRVLSSMICIWCAHSSEWGQEAAMKPKPAEDTSRDYENTVSFPGEAADPWDQHREPRHLTDKVPSDVTMWEEASGRQEQPEGGLPLDPTETWKLF